MSFWERIFKRQTAVTRAKLVVEPTTGFTGYGGDAYANDVYREAVDAIARNAGKLKGSHVISYADHRRVDGDCKLNRLLQTRPNPYMTAYDLLYKLVTHLFIYNNSFAYLDRDDRGNLRGIYPITASSVNVLSDPANNIYLSFTLRNGRPVVLPYGDVIHLRRFFNDDDLLGADNQAIFPGLELANTQNEGIINGIKAGASIRGILKFTQILSPSKLKEEKDAFVKDYLEMGNDGGVVATDQKMDYQPIESKPVILNADQEKEIKAKIYNYLGVTEAIVNSSYTEDQFAAFYRSAFYKYLMGQKLTKPEQAAFDTVVEKRTDAFSASTDVAAAIPTHTLEQVISKARTMGGLMAEARAFSMPSKIAIPIGTPSTKAAWHTEGAAVDTEKVTLSSVTFDGYEIIKIFSISAKARRMTIAAFEAYLVDELTACVMETIGDSLVNGTGSAQGSGLETIDWDAENSVSVGASATATYADVVKVVSLLKRGYSQGAKWAMNNATLYNVFYGMVDSNKRPIFIADPKSESIGKILGFDVVIDDNIADNDAYLGNYSRYLGYNLPEGIAVEVSRESSFKSGLIDYRAMAIADTKPIIEEAFVKLTKASA